MVVTIHGGHEHLPFPSPRMRSWYRFFADCGADAVFSCHTHCPLGYEIYNGVPIVYSPGNFYFPNRPTSLPCWYIGYVPKFLFDGEGAYGMEIMPYFNFKSGLKTMDENDSAAFFEYLDGLCAPIADEKLLQTIFDVWSSRSGYFSSLFNRQKPESFDVREGVASQLPLRNLMTCQAHNDVLKNALLLMERYELTKCRELPELEIITKAQNPEFVKL